MNTRLRTGPVRDAASSRRENSEAPSAREQPPALNENRYAQIIEAGRLPILRLFNKTIQEDTSLLLPRVLLATFGTLKRIPRALLIPRGPAYEDYVFDTFSRWAKKVCRIAQVRLTVTGAEKLDRRRTYLFVSNHLSPADIPVILQALPHRAAFVANAFFSKIPVLSFWMGSSGTVFVQQGDPKNEVAAVKTMARRLKKGRSLILFPEGYIYQGKGVGPFKRGGLFAAVLASVPIVPLCLYGTPRIMKPGGLRLTPRQNAFVKFGDIIEPRLLDRKAQKNIDALVRDTIASMKEELCL